MPDIPIDFPRINRNGAGRVSSPDVKRYHTGSALKDKLAAEHDRIWKVFLAQREVVIPPDPQVINPLPQPAEEIAEAEVLIEDPKSKPFARARKIAEIQKVVAQHSNLSVIDIISKRRVPAIAQTRQIAMYLCRNITLLSYPEIGKWFGGKDHSTVIHGVQKITKLIAKDYVLADEIAMLRERLEK